MAADSTISIEIELQKALRKLDELQKAFDKQNELINQASRAASRFERVIKTSMASATKAVKGALSVFLSLKSAAVGIVAAFSAREFVNFGANYERQISRLNALTRATETEQLRLRKAIREVGSTTAFTATQAAEAANVLAALGRSSNQIAKELGIVVKVAGATGTAIETVSEAVAAQMNVFGESAEQVGNIFAAAFSTSAANVEKLQTALGQVGPVAKAAGLDLTQTAGAISFLVDRGFRAEAAGTALRGVLVRLIDPTKNVLKEFDKLGVSFEEIQQLSFQDQMQKIADQLSNVASQAERNRILTTIFGVEALAAANNFINALSEGNRVIDTQAQKLREATDAATLYNTITSDLRGAVDGLIAAVQEKLLAAFQAVEPLIKEIVNDLTEAVSSITTRDIINTMADISEFLVRGATGFYNTILSAISSIYSFFSNPAFQKLIQVSEAALESLGFRSLDQQISDQQAVVTGLGGQIIDERQNQISNPVHPEDKTRALIQDVRLANLQKELDIQTKILNELVAQKIEQESIFGFSVESLKLDGDYLEVIRKMRDASLKRLEAMEEITTEINDQKTATDKLAEAENKVPSIQKELLAIKLRLKELDLEEQKYFDGILEKAQLQVDAENTILGINQELVPLVNEGLEAIEETNEIEKQRKKNQEEIARLQRYNLFDAILSSVRRVLGVEEQITKEKEKQKSYDEERVETLNLLSGTFVEGIAGAGPNASRGVQVGQAYAAGGGGATGFVNATIAAAMSNEKVQKSIDENFRILFDFIDPLIEILADLQIAINRLTAAFLQGVNNAIDNLSNALNTATFGISDYFLGGGITRDFENFFGIGGSGPRGNVQTGINAAFASADQIFTDIKKDAVGDRDEIQSIVDSLTPLLDTLSLEELIDRIEIRTTEAIDKLNQSVQPLFDALAASGGNPAIMQGLQKQILPIMTEIKNIQQNTDLVITGLVEAFASQPIGVLQGITGSAEDQIRSIDNQSKTQKELIELRFEETVAIIEEQRAFADLIDDEALRTQLLQEANIAEENSIRLKVKQLAQLEREQALLQAQNAQSTLQSILQTFESTMEGIGKLVEDIFDQVTDLLMSEFNLAPAQQQLEIASANYGDLLAAALDPDATEDNIKEFQQFVNEYLRAARDVYKSSSTFQAIFESVLNDLTALGVSSGFNLTTGAVSGATSEIQDFIDATEELDEGLRNTLTSVISDLTDLGEIFQAQLLEFIYSPTGMGIPLVITDEDIKPVLSGTLEFELTENDIDSNIKLVDENGELLKLDFTEAASFTANISGFYSQDLETYPDATQLEESHFGSDVSGFYSQDPSTYPDATNIQSAHFVADTSGWESYDGTATFTAYKGTSQGWKNYSGTAIFNSSFTGDWDSISGTSASADIDVSVGLDSSKITDAFDTLTTSVNTVMDDFADAITSTMTTSLERIEAELLKYEMLGRYGFYFDYNTGPFGGSMTASVKPEFRQEVQNQLGDFDSLQSPYTTQYGYIANDYPYNFTYQTFRRDGDGRYTIQDQIQSMFFEDLTRAKQQYGTIMSYELHNGRFRTMGANFEMTQEDLSNYVQSFATGGLVTDPRDTIPAMLSAGEYIMSPETVKRFGVHSMNRINSGDSAALAATSDPDVKRLLAELIVAVRESDTEINVYTDMKGEAQAAVSEFRSELKERTRRQGETYVPAKYI